MPARGPRCAHGREARCSARLSAAEPRPGAHRDFGACFRFYRDVLGLEAYFGDEDGPYADFRTGEASLALFSREAQRAAVELRPSGDGSVVILAVDDVDSAAERLREHLVCDPADRQEWGIRVLYVRAPAGTPLELNQPL